jgi:hypothetical protein
MKDISGGSVSPPSVIMSLMTVSYGSVWFLPSKVRIASDDLQCIALEMSEALSFSVLGRSLPLP